MLKKIYKTTNSGTSWSQLSPVSTIFHDNLYSIDFIDENVGFVSGGYNQPSTWKTTNAGSSWTQVNSLRFGKMQFIDSQIGYGKLTLSYERIYKTTDGGLNWSMCFSVPSVTINSFYFVDSNVGYVIGDNSLMYKTIDGGLTWQQLNPPYGHYEKIKFYTNNLGYVSDTYNGGFYKTEDGGATWQYLMAFTDATDIEFNNGYIYLSGTFGKIIRSYTGINLGVNNTENSTASNFTIYPNPASHEINVKSIDGKKIKSVILFDVTGKVLINCLNDNYSEVFKVDISNQSKDIYFVKTILEDGKTTIEKLLIN